MEFVTLEEVIDFRNYTITLRTLDGRVLRQNNYTEETFPIGSLQGLTIDHVDTVTKRFPVDANDPRYK